MAQLKDLVTAFDMSDDAKADPEIDAFGASIQVNESGKVHIQCVHDFENSATVITPVFSIDGENFAPLSKNGETISVALESSPSGLIITDLIPGSIMQIGLTYGGQSTGILTIKVAS